MATFSTAGRFGGRVDPSKRGRGVARRLSAADEKKVRSKLRAAAYTAGGIDWHRLFRHYDRDNSGEIGFVEFRRLLRSDAKIPVSQLPDVDVRALYNAVDTDGSGDIEADEFIAWVEGDVNSSGGENSDAREGDLRAKYSGSASSPSFGRNKSSSGYGKVSPTELSSPSQRRFNFQEGTWLHNNDEHSEAEGAEMRKHHRESFPPDIHSDNNSKDEKSAEFYLDNQSIDGQKAQHSAHRAIRAAEQSLGHKRVGVTLAQPPLLAHLHVSPSSATSSSRAASLEAEASMDALLALQRDKDRLASELVELKESARTNHSEAEAWHRVVVKQESELKGYHQDIDAREALIKSQSEQLKALKILVEAQAAEMPGGVSSNVCTDSTSPSLQGKSSNPRTYAASTVGNAGSGDQSTNLVAQMQSQMSQMDRDLRILSPVSTPVPLEAYMTQSYDASKSVAGTRPVALSPRLSPMEHAQQRVQNRLSAITSSAGSQRGETVSLEERDLVTLREKYAKLQAAYNVATDQANELGKEKIDMQHRLRQVSYKAAETEETLKSALRLRDAEVAKLTDELAEELRRHLQVQRDMMAELAQGQQERASLLTRTESSEGRAALLSQQLDAERRANVASSHSSSSMDARLQAAREENERLQKRHSDIANREARLRRALEDMQKDHRAVLEENLRDMRSLKAAVASAEQSRDLAEARLVAAENLQMTGQTQVRTQHSGGDAKISSSSSTATATLTQGESVKELKAVIERLHSENWALEHQLDEIHAKHEELKVKHEGHEDHDEYSAMLLED